MLNQLKEVGKKKLLAMIVFSMVGLLLSVAAPVQATPCLKDNCPFDPTYDETDQCTATQAQIDAGYTPSAEHNASDTRVDVMGCFDCDGDCNKNEVYYDVEIYDCKLTDREGNEMIRPYDPSNPDGDEPQQVEKSWRNYRACPPPPPTPPTGIIAAVLELHTRPLI